MLAKSETSVCQSILLSCFQIVLQQYLLCIKCQNNVLVADLITDKLADAVGML